MNSVVNLMVNTYGIREFGLDFLGFRVTNKKDLSYHHLIIPKELGGEETVENGAILLKKSHHYLHVIEKFDREIFKQITEQMIIENKKGHIDLENLVIIDKLLLVFEKDYARIIKGLDLPTRFLREVDKEILENIDKYELKKNLR